MKRPLALCGCVVLMVSLAAAGWPARVCVPLAVLLAAAFLVPLALYKVKRNPRAAYAATALVAACFALGFRAVYDVAFVMPVQARAGGEYTVTAHVRAVEPGGAEEIVYATVEVRALDGVTVRPFEVELSYIEEVRVGQDIELEAAFSMPRSGRHAQSYYGAGQYLLAKAKSEIQVLADAPDWLDRLRIWQYGMGDSIRTALPERLGSVAAAMTVGDRRYLPGETRQDYKMAGLSHLLVVSGLHLVLVCGGLARLLRRLTGNRRAASIGGMLLAVAFALFTGLTPSIVRAGVMFCILMVAPLLSRRADTYTSLGFAALVLCLQNPYAAASAGLLLSFSATLGAVLAGQLQNWLKPRWPARRIPMRLLRRVALAALVPLVVTLATLPVVAFFGLGLSLLTVPMNIIAVPLLPVVVVSGFFMAIPTAAPLVGLLARPAAFVGGVAAVWLEKLTGWCGQQGWAYIHVGGAFLLVVLAVVYFLVWRAVVSRRFVLHLGTAAACVALAVALHTSLSRGTVTVVLAGNTTPSVVAAQNGQAVILYRGLSTDSAITVALDALGVKEVKLVVDLRQNGQGTQYTAWNPQEVLLLGDINSHTAAHITGDITLGVRRQGNGSLVCLQIGHWLLGTASGNVDVAAYPELDFVLSGGVANGHVGPVLVTGISPEWAQELDVQLVESGGGLWLRPAGGYRYREVRNGELDG